ncbi:hypothetical protein BS78_05G179400 [Paspalum vaginatum]|nr:hypothetical protein BS78_05G179400 [Paspalum vaginatum]
MVFEFRSLWPDLIGRDVREAVPICLRQRPDIRIVRVLGPGNILSPLPPGVIRLIVYNDNFHRVLPPGPYLG